MLKHDIMHIHSVA